MSKHKKDKVLQSDKSAAELRKETRKKNDRQLDKTLESTFPASDATAKY